MFNGSLGLDMQGGYLQNIPPNATQDQQIAVLNDVVNRLNDLLKVQVFSDGTTKRFVNGYVKGGFPDGDFGMKISAPGYDVIDPDAVLLYYWDYTSNTQVVYNNGIPTILEGSAPDDGRAGIWQTIPGENVITELGG